MDMAILNSQQPRLRGQRLVLLVRLQPTVQFLDGDLGQKGPGALLQEKAIPLGDVRALQDKDGHPTRLGPQ